MLLLPVLVAPSGFLGASLVLLLSAGFMMSTAFLLLQANSWFPVGTHFVNTAERILGPLGKWITWLIYLFIAYASLAAYINGGADIVKSLLGDWASELPGAIELLFTLICGAILALGAKVLARCNSLFFALMMALFAGVLLMGLSHFELRPFHECRLTDAWKAVPLLLTAFSFQMIVPSLRSYLSGDLPAVRRSIGWGLVLTLLIYLSWMAYAYAILPSEGPYSLQAASQGGYPVTVPLIQVVQSPILLLLILLFSLFAIVTSFLGISLGLYEFLDDSLALQCRRWAKPLLLALVLVPSFLLAIGFDRVFIRALELSGGIGDSILNGLIPVAMVAVGAKAAGVRLSGSRHLLLLLCGCFALTILSLELMRLLQGAI